MFPPPAAPPAFPPAEEAAPAEPLPIAEPEPEPEAEAAPIVEAEPARLPNLNPNRFPNHLRRRRHDQASTHRCGTTPRTYIQWDPELTEWMEWSEAQGRWIPISR